MKQQIKAIKALVTGSTGFIGSHLSKRLVSEGWDVHVIVRPESNLKLIQDLKKVTVYRYEGSTEEINAIIKKASPNVVFHLASLFLVQHEAKNIENMIRSNILFGTQLVEAMTSQGIRCLVNTGTSWQHYENEGYNPVNLYAATKQAFEDILKYYTETTQLKVITLKLYDTYGPDDPRAKLFSLLQRSASEQKTMVMSPGDQLIDLVYIDDVIEAFILAADRLQTEEVKPFEEYIVTSGKPIKLRELVEMYSRITGKALSIQWGGRSYRPREVMTPWNKGNTLPNWRPRITLEDGIKRFHWGKTTISI